MQWVVAHKYPVLVGLLAGLNIILLVVVFYMVWGNQTRTTFDQLRGYYSEDLEDDFEAFDGGVGVIVQDITVSEAGLDLDASFETDNYYVLAACGDTPYIETAKEIELIAINADYFKESMRMKSSQGDYDNLLINVC